MEQEGGEKHSDGTEWPVIADEERRLYEILFYSQGPVDGYLLGEGVRDLFLKSGLSLRVLSQIWNLADVSNDNVLNVHEFSLVMHLIRGLLKGLKAPLTLPRKLAPPKTVPLTLTAVTPREREAYVSIFRALDTTGQGFLDGECCRQVFEASGLTSEVLATVWDLCDVTRDGKLDVDEFCVACHLLRYIKAGHSITGPVDVFTELPNKVDPQSLRARKRRVQQYEQHKQKLMALKEKRRQQVTQENKRLQLQQEKLDLLRQVYKEQKKRGQSRVKEEQFSVNVATQKEEIEKLEEIVYRLKKEHEKVRQETVRIILAEQKLNTDIVTIKQDTDELNRRLGTCHTHASKDTDPFHQLYEQRKEKRQGSTIKDLDKIEVALPFTFNPFDPGLTLTVLAPGALLFAASAKGNNHHKGGQWQSAMEPLADFGEEFEAQLASSSSASASVGGEGKEKKEEEGDAVFKEVSVSMDTERWLGFQWGPEDENGVLGLSGPDTEVLQEKLLTLRAELRKLNQPGTRLLFKNPEDYLARKRAKEEEEKEKDRSRFQRRSVTERRSLADISGDASSSSVKTRAPRKRHSYTERNEQVSQAVREYRQKRQFLHSADSANSSASSSPRETRKSTADPDRSGKAPLTSDFSFGLSAREEVEVSASRAVRQGEPTEAALRWAPASQPGQREEKSALGPSGGVGGPEQVPRDSRAKGEAAGELVLDFSAPPSGRVSSEERSAKREAEKAEKVPEQQPDRTAKVQQSSLSSSLDKQTITSVGRKSRQESDSVENHITQTTVISVKSQSSGSSNAQRSERPDPVQVSTDPVPAPKSTADQVQRSTSSESDPGISQTRPSSKKSRAPPPPPTGSASASPAASPPLPESFGGQGPTAAAGDTKPAQQIVPSSAVSVQSQPAPGQTSSPERPARPKRRKESGNGTASNPSSPREVPVQQEQARVQSSKVPTVTDPLRAPPQPLQLTENVLLEEEAPPTQGTAVLSGKKSSSVKDKSANRKADPGSAHNVVVPPLLLNGDGQTPAAAAATSGQGGSSDPVKQKRRKGKAPEPPSSTSKSPRDVLLSASSTPSPSASPRDAPSLSRPAEDGPGGARVAPHPAELKSERRRSCKTKAPPPPEPPRSHPGPKTVQETPSTAVLKVTRESVTESPKVQLSSSSPVAASLSTQNSEPAVAQASLKDSGIAQDVWLQARGDSAAGTNRGFQSTANHEEDTAAKDVAFISSGSSSNPESERGRASESSSICESDAESLPPPLPSSAPPPLPSIPPPSPLPTRVVGVEEEEVEVRQVSTTHTLPPGVRREKGGRRMEDGVLEFDSLQPDTLPDTAEDPQTAMANLRAQFFGLNSTGQSSNGNNGQLDTDVDELDRQSADSDASSDDREVEGTFSPGDSGVVLSSLPTSPDDGENRVQLLSYTSTTTLPSSSSLDTRSPLITNNSSNSSNTIITVTTSSTSSSSSSSQRPQSLSVRGSSSTSSGDSLLPSSASASSSQQQQQLMSAQDMAALSPRSRDIFEKARHFAEMVQPKATSSSSKREEDGGGEGEKEEEEEEEFSQQTWQDLEMERRAVISQCTPVKRKGVGVLSPTTPTTNTTATTPSSSSLSSSQAAVSVSMEREEEEEIGDFDEDRRWRTGDRGLGFLGSTSETTEEEEEGYFRTEVREPAAPSAQQRSGLTHSGNNDPAAAADRSHSPVDVGWQVKDTQRLVNLYSENVVQEPSSTEVVDRESIANLTSTRGKWEAIFTSTEPRDEPAAKPTSKWQVRMPYAEKPCAGPDTVSSNNLPSEEPDSPPPEEEQQPGAGVDMESAIEREIRLAVEREDMLRREQEERLRQLSQQASGGVKGSSSMESSTESELQPSYHELAEADRGSQFFLNHNASVHHRHQQQEEDAEREESLQRGYSVHQKLSKSQVGATESIIEREIRLQREREAELARQRGGRVAPSAVAPDSSPRGESEDGGEVEVVLVEEIPYENAISRYNHDGESRIAQELRELREREDEVRQLRERMLRTSVSGAPDASSQQKTSAVPPSSLSPANSKATAKPPSTPQGGNRSTPTTPHVDKSPSISFSRSFHSSPLVEPPATPPPSKTTPTPKPETPIEREIRLARDRENELRRSKGLPDLKPEPQKQDSFEERGREREEEVVTPRHPFYNPSQPDSTMRRFASNRLQQEMLVQHNREMKLRQEGKIISMSEEHIQPQKYTEVVAHDQTDGVVKRNFRTPARRNSNASQDSNASGDVTLRSGQVSAPSPHATPREGGGSGKKTTAGTGAVSFSYREFAQTAESKIERELREMSEREEELRKLRSGVAES